MKNKLVIFVVGLAVLSAYPIWRYNTNSKIFANAIVNHVSKLGKWSNGSISSNFDGEITIRNLSFVPSGRTQGFEIESVKIKTEPMFILKSSASKLEYMLPETLSISLNAAVLNASSGDIENALRDNSLWMMLIGYAGSFGCDKGKFTSFNPETWNKFFDKNQVFNLDLFYSRQDNGSLDVDLILDAENQFSSTWSSNLKSSFTEKQIFIDELIVEKLYYSYLDNGFNLARNNACKENYKSSFAAYRLSSAEHIQKFFRTFTNKELPNVLLNIYQRLLVPDVEFNAIIDLNSRKYVGQIYHSNQREFFENAQVEISTSQNKYIPITLTDIDYKNLDSDMLKQENIAREEWLKEKESRKSKKRTAKDILTPKIYTTGKKTSRHVSVSKIATLINKKIRVKTHRGRPVTGYLLNLNDGSATIQSKYKTGSATLSIPVSNIKSIELMR